MFQILHMGEAERSPNAEDSRSRNVSVTDKESPSVLDPNGQPAVDQGESLDEERVNLLHSPVS